MIENSNVIQKLINQIWNGVSVILQENDSSKLKKLFQIFNNDLLKNGQVSFSALWPITLLLAVSQSGLLAWKNKSENIQDFNSITIDLLLKALKKHPSTHDTIKAQLKKLGLPDKIDCISKSIEALYQLINLNHDDTLQLAKDISKYIVNIDEQIVACRDNLDSLIVYIADIDPKLQYVLNVIIYYDVFTKPEESEKIYHELKELKNQIPEDNEINLTLAFVAFDLISIYGKAGKPEESERIYCELFALAMTSNNSEIDLLIAKSAVNLIADYTEFNKLVNIERAETIYREILCLPKSAKINHALAKAAFNLVLIWGKLANPVKAEKFYHKMIELRQEFPSIRGINLELAYAAFNLVIAWGNAYNPERAESIYFEMERLKTRFSQDEEINLLFAQASFNLVTYWGKSDDPARAKSIYDKLKAFTQTYRLSGMEKVNLLFAKAAVNLGTAWSNICNPDTPEYAGYTNEIYEELKELIRKNIDWELKKELANAAFNLVTVLCKVGNIAKAKNICQELKELVRTKQFSENTEINLPFIKASVNLIAYWVEVSNPNTPEYAEYANDIYIELKQIVQTNQFFQNVEINLALAKAAADLVFAWIKTNMIEKAKKSYCELKEICKLFPVNAEFNLILAKVVSESGLGQSMFVLASSHKNGKCYDRNLSEAKKQLQEDECIGVLQSPFFFHLFNNLPDNLADNISTHIRELMNVVGKIKRKNESPAKVCHFTTISALESMLNFKELKNDENIEKKGNHFRLYNVNHMNDPEEGQNLLLWANNNASSFKKNMTDGKTFLEMFFPNNNIDDGNFGIYCASFTIEEDRLDLWRAYGKDGSGFCISIPSSAFKYENDGRFLTSKFINPIGAADGKDADDKKVKEPLDYIDDLTLYKVRYDDESKKETVRDINKVLEEIHREIETWETGQQEIAKVVVRWVLYDILFLFKNDQYSSEKEYRLLSAHELGDKLLKMDDREPPRLYIKTNDFLFKHKGTEIIIGPKAKDSHDVKRYLEHLLMKRGFFENVKVKLSSVKYR